MSSILILCFCVLAIQCNEIKNQIYYEIPNESVSHCVRRLNSTSSIGCSSKSNGNVGVIEVTFTEVELISKLNILKEDTIIVINTDLFVIPNITDQILQNTFITGLIVFEQENCNGSFCNKTLESFSEDYKIPNQLYSFSINKTYNPAGTEYAFKSWPFPVSLISKRYKTEQDKIIACYKRFNSNPQSNRKCALEIRNFMAAVNSSDTCLKYEAIQNKFISFFHRVNFCGDFTGMNYVVHTYDKVTHRDPNSVIVLISRLDSLSMFERSAFNVHGTVTSAALLLSVMSLLTSQPEFRNPDKLKKDVLFLFLDNESYDYLGSNRFVLELEDKTTVAKGTGVPINFTHLDLLLEFGEMGFSNFSETSFFYPRFAKENSAYNKTVNYVENLWKWYEYFGFQNSFTVQDLPPSSVQYFLRKELMPAIVMSDYRDKFKNVFYNSYLDDKKMRNNSKELIAIVNSVASFVFQEVTGRNLTQLMNESDKGNPYNIIDCFTNNIRCDLLKEVLTTKTIENFHLLGTPIPTQAYTDTNELFRNYRFSYILHNLIVFLSGQEVNKSLCDKCPKCENLTSIETGSNSSHCYKTRIGYASMFSYEVSNISAWYSSTVVNKQSIKMFVQAPNTPLLVTGILITLTMTIFMTLISSRMSEIFQRDS